MNEYDSNRIYDLTSAIGFKKTDIKKDADCFVLNTCHIREKATEKVYDEIGRVKKDFKNLKKPLVIVSGCVAQAESGEMIKREPYIDMVIGPQSYHKIGDLIFNYQRKKQKINETEFDVIGKFDYLQKISNSQNKISSYLTIQEGCDKFCHFCVVPYTRGPEYSRPFEQIINEAHTLVSNGAKEIILLGQNVNAYNFYKNNKNYKLSSLINELNNIKNLKRIRFTTSHPKDMTEDLINCYKDSEKLMPFLHLPIQSGSNKVLKSMNRKHHREDYMSIIKKLKNINKDIKISSDFIIGYPNETEKDSVESGLSKLFHTKDMEASSEYPAINVPHVSIVSIPLISWPETTPSTDIQLSLELISLIVSGSVPVFFNINETENGPLPAMTGISSREVMDNDKCPGAGT